MPTQQSPSAPAAQVLVLTESERVVVAAIKLRLLRRDRATTTNDARLTVRADQIMAAVDGLREALADAGDASWAVALSAELAVADEEMRAGIVDDAVNDLGSTLESRSRALLVLVEACLFVPERPSLNGRARERTLRGLITDLPGLDVADLELVKSEVAAARRALARRQIKWGRVAAVSAAGVGLGVATMGAATPVIAAAVAGAGLSGAAATSTGLAILGGGSLAAGGFGVAGGSMLLTGVGAVSGLGAGMAGSWFSGWSVGQIAEEALRLAVATRVVVIEEQRDEEMAKRVVLALQERLDGVTAKLDELAGRLRELNDLNSRLSAENRRLCAELRAERGDTEQVGAALETALELIPATA